MRNLDREMLHGNAETLVLALLSSGACHGYRLRLDLIRRSRNSVQLAFGRLYPLLRTMERQGLVTARWVRVGKARERRQYTITAKGRAELRQRKLKWQQFSAAMNRVLVSI
jgi:PadR family transcriptional regulator PadR